MILFQERIDKFQHVWPVHSEDAAGAAAGPIEAIGSHPGDDVRIAQEVGSTRVPIAGSTSIRVVGQQQREIIGEASVDLKQFGVCYHAHAVSLVFPGSRIREAFLQAVSHGCKCDLWLLHF